LRASETEPASTLDAVRLSRWGYAGLTLLSLHVLLLFFPPIPPDVKGSLWWWVTGYASVALLLVEADRHAVTLAAAWGGLPRPRRWARALGVALALFGLGLAFRTWAPIVYGRFEREEGLWEPLTLLCYLVAAAVLYRSVGAPPGLVRRHRRFVAAIFLLLGLEEIDYFGVFGAIFGRIQGVYAGSPHDLIRLAAKGVLGPAAWAAVAGVLVALVTLLWRTEYLQPRALAAMVGSRDFLWVVAGFLFLFAGAALDAELFGLRMAQPAIEELLELVGAVFLFGYGLSVASGWLGDVGRSGRQASDPSTASIRSSASSSSSVGTP
jgi:hypothetical protein